MTIARENRGAILLNAVERVLDAPAAEHVAHSALSNNNDVDAAAERVISHYANRSGLVGAFAAAPAIVPGWGTAASVGLFIAEMSYVLKLEVEMCLALCVVHGMSARVHDTRQLCLALAAVELHRVRAHRSLALDLGEVSAQSVMHYTPRELSKLTLRVCGEIACRHAAKFAGEGLLRVVPAVGSIVSFSMNNVLARRIGGAAHLALKERPRPSA